MAAPVFRFAGLLASQASFSICRACQNVVWNAAAAVRWNSNRAVIAKTNRKVYTRQYPVLVVNPDGSTFRIKYKEPRKLIKLPLDVNSLTFDERKKRLGRYQVRKKRVVKDDLDDDADVTGKYRHLWNKP